MVSQFIWTTSYFTWTQNKIKKNLIFTLLIITNNDETT
jgi:hypothetical protein